jgi:hypothetical protein
MSQAASARLNIRKAGRRTPQSALLVGAASLMLLRSASLRWGASRAEIGRVLPGDELLAHASLSATRAITIKATAGEVWPWIAQLGQARGGFYSYDFLENLVGCDIHSARRIVEQWQNPAAGDLVNLAPEVALTVASVNPGSALVLRGGVPALVAKRSPYEFTWSFILLPGPAASTRLVVRERYSYSRWWVAALVEPVEMVSLLMSRKMMRSIRSRVQAQIAGAE